MDFWKWQFQMPGIDWNVTLLLFGPLKSAKRYELSQGVLATKDILQKTFSTSSDLGVEAPLIKGPVQIFTKDSTGGNHMEPEISHSKSCFEQWGLEFSPGPRPRCSN